MVRYINKQKHKDTCGPVAFINALKWDGYISTYETDLELIKQVVGYVPNEGATEWFYADEFLSMHFKRIKKLTTTSSKEVRSLLKQYGGAIISYAYIDKIDHLFWEHIIFMRYEKGKYYAYNIGRGHKNDKVPWRHLSKCFQHYGAEIIFLEKG